MAKTKGSSKKQQKRGIDFKKIKRKIGRKLPPPKNTTNTEIKSKAIVLPEQSVASEKAGLAVSKKGLTLKELLQHTSHHNAKVRKDALMGMKDLFLNHPEELKLHRYAVIEKLRERMSDDEKTVRENLYQLLKLVILPGCKEDNQGPVISLMMAYIFNAMTHLAIDVRLMAFKFFDLAVEYHPPSFFSYAEKILQNYEDILRKNQFYLEDKVKLKNALAGLVRCLLLLPSSKDVNLPAKNIPEKKILQAFEPDVPTVFAEYSVIIKKLKDLVPVLVNCFQDFLPVLHDSLDAQSFDCMLNILRSIDLAVAFFIHGIQQGHPESPPLDQSFSSVLLKKLLVVFPLSPMHHLSEKDDDRYVILNIVITEIFMHLSEWICPPAVLFEKFLTFVEYVLLEKSCSNVRSNKAVREKQISTLIPFIPKLVSRVIGNWKNRLLQAFTKTFQDCSPESSVKLACLAAIEEMVISHEDLLCTDVNDSGLFDYKITWIRELPMLLILLGDRHSSSSKVVLHLLLRLGQRSLLYDDMQGLLKEFYSTDQDKWNICYGPFLRLARDSQELSICCLYYFSQLDSTLLKSIASCCLCHELDPFMLFRIIEVLHSTYKAGRIQISDFISFLITLASRFKVFPENIFPATERDKKTSNRATFKSLISVVCSCLSQMGDNSLVFAILEKVILEQISLKPPLDNSCAMLRMLVALDSKPTRLSKQSICSLSNVLSAYLIDVAHCVPEDDDESMSSIHGQTRRYYLLPSFILFDRSHKLLNLVLNVMGSSINGSFSLLSGDRICYAKGSSSIINAIVSVLLWMQREAKVQQILYLYKEEIDHISQSICSLQSLEEINVPIEERHIIKCAIDRLKTLTSSPSLSPSPSPCANHGPRPNKESGFVSEQDSFINEIKEEKISLSIDDVVRHLKCGNDEEFRLALLVLGDLIRDQVFEKEWINDEDIIPILFNRLGSSKPHNRLTTIQILRILASENDENKDKMTDAVCLSVLVKSLARDTDEGREAVGLLSELADISAVRRRIGRIQGCIVMLVTMHNGDDPTASQDAAKLLVALSSNPQNVLHMAEAGYFKPLVHCLKEGSDKSKILMATAVSRMELTDLCRASLGEDGAVEPLVRMFKSGKLEARLAALNALQNLSNLTENIKRLISSGIVVPLLQLLFSVTSVLMTLREPASAILARIAQSATILVKRDVAQQMLSLLNLSSPVIQYHLLQALNSIASHSSASKVRRKMKENCAVQLLLPFLTESNTNTRTAALNLLYTLSKDSPEEFMEQLGESYLSKIVGIISSPESESEKAAAIGILSNLPVGNKKSTEALKKLHFLPILISLMSSGASSSTTWLEESISGMLIRFTVPSDKKLQLFSAELGIIPILVKLLSSESSVAKCRAATSLAQLSQNSLALQKSRKSRWICMPPSADTFCQVHDGYCIIKSTFCLVKAGAVPPLIQILEGKDREADEAALNALATLLQDEIRESGSLYIAKTSGVQAIIRVLESGTVKAQEKALWMLERIFRIEEHRSQYGESAQVVLIDLAQNGDPRLKSTIARVLAQLELLQAQSSYF